MLYADVREGIGSPRRRIWYPLQEIHPFSYHKPLEIWSHSMPLPSLIATSSKSFLRPTQVEGGADVEGWQRWLRVDGLCVMGVPCGADWAVCWLYATSWYVWPVLLSCLVCILMFMFFTASSPRPDNFILKDSSVQLTGLTTSLLNVQLE